MATTSTEEQNDPEADNRQEYEVPPCAEPNDEGLEFDSDGFEVGDSETVGTFVGYDSYGFAIIEGDELQEEEGDDTLSA